MSSGVRNLRAMFEKEGAASPEPRGRSPGDTPAPEQESRPTPKVRASFISVEPTASIPPPDLGATKGTPTNSVAAHRRESFHISLDNAEGIAELKKVVSEEKAERKQSIAVAEAVPEEAVASRESSIPAPPIRAEPAGEMANLGAIMKGSDFPEPSAAETKKVETAPVEEAAVQPPQTPVKEKKKPAKLIRAETPAKGKTETPAKAKTETQAKPKVQEKPAAAPTSDAPAAPQVPAKIKEEPTTPPEVDAPVPAETHADPEKELDVAPSVDAPAEPQPVAQEEPVVDTPKEAPVPAESPAKSEPEPVQTPAQDTPAAAPIEKEEPTSTPSEDAPAPLSPPAKAEDEPVEAPTTEAPADNPDKAVTGAQEEVSLKPADLTDEATVSGGQALPPPAEPLQASSTPEPVAATPKAPESKAKSNGTPSTKGKPEIKKPAAISTAKASASKVAPGKSPLPKSMPRTPTTPKTTSAAPATKPSLAAAKTKPATAKPTVPKAEPKTAAPKAEPKPAAAKEPVKAAAPKTSRLSIRPGGPPTATAPTASAASKTRSVSSENKKPAVPKPATSSTSTVPAAGGFKKPPPKSPTRPVRLPTHLTAPTAASAAKHGEEQKVTRKPSTTTRPKTVAPGTRSSRTSLAPTTTAPKRPDSRASTTSGAPKGDFLSRMMRPTAASASKTHEKPASPPRKSTKAPVGVLQKGKNKVEEMAAKAKDAVTTNGHDAAETKSNGTSVNEEATEDHAEPGASEEPVDAAPSAHEDDASVAVAQTSQETTVG